MQEPSNNSSVSEVQTADDQSNIKPQQDPTLQPEKLTEKQMRELRRIHVTRRNPTVIACQHKLKLDKHPTNNCVYCWQAYFHTQANIEELFIKLRTCGVKKFTAKYGLKFTKNLRGFVAAELMKNRKEEKEQENRGTGWDNNGLGVIMDGEKLQIEGSPIPDTIGEAATELKLPTGE